MQLSLLQSSFSTIEPREYQTAAVDATFANWALRPASSQIIVAPCGAGKTVMIGMVAQRYLEGSPGQRVLCLTHVSELVDQNYVTFRSMFPNMSAGVYAAKLGRKDRRAKVTFAMIQSVARNVDAFRDCGLIIVDEAHLIPHADDGQYRDVIRAIRKRRGAGFVKILGLSGTPYRLNSGNLLEPYKDQPPLFDEVAYDIEMLDLLEEGYLCPVISRGTKTKLDVHGIHKRGGEYVEAELDAKFNTDAINAAIASEIAEAGQEQDRRSWAVFCITVDHATRMRDLIRSHGITCEMVCGETPTAERARIIRDFKQYKVRCLTSINVLGTGFNHPGIDLVALARPTASPGVYVQQSGRALRLSPGKKNALLLDFAGCVMRHGLLTSVKGIFKKAKKDEEEDDEAAVKECPACMAIVAKGSLTCSECGHVWEKREVPDREAKLFGKNTAAKVMDEATWVGVLSANYRTTGGNGKPATLMLTYQVHGQQGAFQASEFFCLDHPGGSWALAKARQHWTKRTGLYAPASVAAAVARIHELRRPTQVRVAPSDDGKFMNVSGVKFDNGKGF